MSTEALVGQATSQSGDGTVRPGSDHDVIDGVRPRVVAQPRTAETLAATLGWASREQLSVLVRGGGTKLEWGGVAQACDVLLSTAALDAVVEHRHGDLTATIQAGARLATVNAALAEHGQWLPLDPPRPERATIGGVVATNDSGPRRHRHGAPRDLIIGITMARERRPALEGWRDRRQERRGLRPLASSNRVVRMSGRDRQCHLQAGADRCSVADGAGRPRFTRCPVLCDRHAVQLGAYPDSDGEQQAREAIGLVAGDSTATILSGDAESELWAHAGRWEEPGTVVKLSTRPTALVATLGWLQDACDKHDLQLAAAGRAGLGVVHVWLRGPAEGQVRVIAQLRERLPGGDGSAVIRRGDAVLRRQVDPWGPVGDSLPLMQAVKMRFDPEGTLNLGRGPGGL